MLIKRFSFLLMIFTFCNVTNLDAQKVKTKTLSFEYLHLPSIVLPEGFKTYSVSYSGKNYTKEHLKPFKAGLRMENYKRVHDEGDIRIDNRVSFSLPVWFEIKVVTDTVWHKESVSLKNEGAAKSNDVKKLSEDDSAKAKTPQKKTQKRVKEINWKVTGKLTQTLKYQVYYLSDSLTKVDAYGSSLQKATTFVQSYDKKKYKTDKDAREAWKEEASYKELPMLPGFIKAQTAEQNKFLKKSFGTYPVKGKIAFYHIKKPKDANEEKLNDGVTVIEKVLLEMKGTKPIDELALITDDAIQHWMEAKEYFSIYDKKQKKAHGACLHNIAAAYYALDEFDLAIEYLEECEKLDFRKRPLKPKMPAVITAKELVKKNKKTGRHFEVNRY